ncbi:uncharacterized protein LOC141610939 [Silene latifolia]|uniref:uncharacterized protein LOC141610939 n=1 Tax=Silene latifolia TaxID=37657 RepID=UPI003D786734
MAIKLLYSYQLTNPKSGVAVSLTSTKSARGRPIEAAPGFVRLRKDIQHSCSSKSVRCVMSDTSLHEGAVGVAYKDGVVIVGRQIWNWQNRLSEMPLVHVSNKGQVV